MFDTSTSTLVTNLINPDPNLEAAKELQLHHFLQIEALLKPGLSQMQRVADFAQAAEFTAFQLLNALERLNISRVASTAAAAVWNCGVPQKSLFADLPGCSCPVIETYSGRQSWPGIPEIILDNWNPTEATLLDFSRVQIKERFQVTL